MDEVSLASEVAGGHVSMGLIFIERFGVVIGDDRKVAQSRGRIPDPRIEVTVIKCNDIIDVSGPGERNIRHIGNQVPAAVFAAANIRGLIHTPKGTPKGKLIGFRKGPECFKGICEQGNVER